ncbi:MAG TPA: ABC transporter substrate-binding protein, partial [Pseudogracilibacillus sp.]|nr:ABC transporter substrate-binding protein [Pseudogracilibacillus sp.]
MKLKRSLVLMLAMFLLVLAACADKKSDEGHVGNEDALKNLTDEGLPIVEEEIEIRAFAGKAATTADDWNDVLLLNEYEEMSNVKINWEMVPADGLEEKRNLALSQGDDLPDLFYAANIPISDIQKYGEQGMFVPLEDLI